jgi:peptidyl-prolyl cis-trans isomerase SurA
MLRRQASYPALRGVVKGLIAGAALLVGLGMARPCEASIVERIVAVVGERPILLSDLRQRGRPHLWRIAASAPSPTQQAAQESEMFRELLNRLIDETLEENAAGKAHISVSPEEIDNGIRQVANQTKLQPADVINEAKKQGLTEQDYRDEIRRQVLEGKLIQLRVRGRVRVTDLDAHAAYERWQKEIAQQQPVDLKIIVLQISPGGSPQAAAAREALAQDIVMRARRGDDYCALVTQFSQDPSTLNTCGSRGLVPMAALFPELQQAAKALKTGETSDPIPFRDPMGNSAILVVQLANANPTLPPFEQVKEQMMERAFGDATERQRKLWLTELRRGVYIDVRL